ncbi:MAG: hypothetical protein ABEJ61_01940 [Haloferacaceae archaeon]
MKFKRIPDPPADRAGVERAREAVSRVPDPEADCCRRIAARLDLPRDEGRAWLALLRALGLVERTANGYRRTDADPSPAALRRAFRERVYGAADALAALADGPLAADAVADELAVPAWERRRTSDPEAAWRERTRRLLDWLVLLGLAERTPDGYAARDDGTA